MKRQQESDNLGVIDRPQVVLKNIFIGDFQGFLPRTVPT